MSKDELAKIEKKIEKKIKIPEQTNTSKKFVVDVDKLKKLAKRLNDYEAESHVSTQH